MAGAASNAMLVCAVAIPALGEVMLVKLHTKLCCVKTSIVSIGIASGIQSLLLL